MRRALWSRSSGGTGCELQDSLRSTSSLRAEHCPFHELISNSRHIVAESGNCFAAAAHEQIAHRMLGAIENRFGHYTGRINGRRMLRLLIEIVFSVLGVGRVILDARLYIIRFPLAGIRA